MNPRRFSLALLLPLLAFAQAPNVADILRRSDEASKKNDPQAELYAYREYIVKTEFDKNGKEQDRHTETWDVIGLEGSAYRKLIQRDDKPLATKEQKSEDKRLTEETKKRQKENTRPPKNGLFSRTYSIRFNSDSVHLFDVSYQGEEMVNGRPAYVIEGVPKASARPANDNEKELLYYRVKFWIDTIEFQHTRFEMEVVQPGSRMQQGSLISAIFRRLDDGVWVMSEMQFDYDVRFFKVAGSQGKLLTTHSDFHKFEVSSRVIDDPK